MKVRYIDKAFRKASLALISAMNAIVEEYLAQGFRLTVRQLHYQLVARGITPNEKTDYDRAVRLCSDARLAGLMDWDAIEDRTREFIRQTRWRSGAEIMQVAADTYHQDRWANQAHRVFCIVEKDALSGVLAPTCRELDMPLLAARGYPSFAVIREFAIGEINSAIEDGQEVVILHLGDHDPRGLDMTRDLKARLSHFIIAPVRILRLALNLEQVRQLDPPANFIKETDTLYNEYRRQYGDKCWELDALPPDYLARLVESHAGEFIDLDAWQVSEQAILETQARLKKIAADFDKLEAP